MNPRHLASSLLALTLVSWSTASDTDWVVKTLLRDGSYLLAGNNDNGLFRRPLL
jgi:hypothetical protein